MSLITGHTFVYRASTALALLSILIALASPLHVAFAAQTNFVAPTTNTNNGWDNPQDAYSSNNVRAVANSDADVVQYGGFSLPAIEGTITGIEVSVEGYSAGTSARSTGPQAILSLSWDGGASYTSGASGVKTTNLPRAIFRFFEVTRTYGGSSDTWGHTWLPAELANLQVKLDATNAAGTLHVDHLRVRVFYAPTVNTTTTITSDTPDPSTVGQAYTVSVAVTPATGTVRPTGTVTISDGTNSCASTAATNGTGAASIFSCALTSSTEGTKTLTASYASTNGFNTSVGTTTHIVTVVPDVPPPPSETFSKGMVSISFDDGTKSVYDAVITGNVLQGLPSTQYVYSIPMYGATLCNGACYTDYMSTANVQTLAAAGHEIASHTRSHRDLSTLSGNDSLFDISGSRLDFLALFPNTTLSNLAFPYGGFNATVKQHLQTAGYTGGRTVNIIGADGQPNLNTPSTDRFELFSGQVTGNSPITPTDPLPSGWNPEFGTVQTWIDKAIQDKQWLILTLHEVKADCGADNFCVTPAKLTQIVNYIKSKGSAIDVVTVGQGLSRMNNAPIFDGVAPVITVPQTVNNNISANATSASGASVAFTPAVSDTNIGLNAFCVLPDVTEEFIFPGNVASGIFFPKVVSSGATFPIGTTNVKCSAADVGGKVGTYTFTVTVTAQ